MLTLVRADSSPNAGDARLVETVSRVLLFSLTAALNPTLLTATTVMLLLPDPKRLMLGYLLGAFAVSVTLGLIIVSAFDDAGTVETTKRTLSPAADIVLGILLLGCAALLATGRVDRARDRRKRTRELKRPPRWQRTLSKGSARTAFVVGVLLTLPGASYLAALHQLHGLDHSTATNLVVIVGINAIMLVLLETPLLSFAIAPKWTPGAIERGKAWVASRWHRIAVRGLGFIGVALIIKGIVGLLV